MSKLTQRGIAALKNGDRNRARQLLRAATQDNPDDIQAWLWLSGALETDQERAACLHQVLRLDPDNALAAQGLAKLVARGTVSLQPSGETTVREAPSQPAASDQVIFRVRPSLFLVGINLPVSLIICTILVTLGRRFRADATALSTFFFVLAAVFALSTGVQIIRAAWTRLFAQYTLTDKRLIVRTGFIRRSCKVIPVNRIHDVSYTQNILERLVGIGDVIVESAGERGAIRLIDLPHCHDYSEMILQVIQN